MSLTIISPDDAQASAQVSTIRKAQPKALEALIMAAIVDVGKLTQSKLDGDLAAKMADGLISDWWHLKIDDVLLALSKGARGHYGKIYGSVGAPDLHEWLTAYDAERSSLYGAKNKALKNDTWNGDGVDVDYKLYIANQKAAPKSKRLSQIKVVPEDLEALAKKREIQQAAFEKLYGTENKKAK